MAVALRDLDRDPRRAHLRVIRSPAPAPTPPSVYWLRRALVVFVALGVLLGVVSVVNAMTAGPPEQLARTNLTVVVGPGQTLWDIAAQYAPADRDRTAWAAEIAERNGVDAQAVRPGTPLVLPLETAAVTATAEWKPTAGRQSDR
jgi:LysM domain